MWAVFLTAVMAACHHRFRFRPYTWRIIHASLAVVIVISTVIQAVLIQGTIETFSKFALCGLTIVAGIKVMIDLRLWRRRSR